MKLATHFTQLAIYTVMALGSTAPASAAVVFYTDKAAFLAAVINPGVDTYNDLSVSLTASPLNRAAGAYTYGAAASVGNFFPGSLGGGDTFLATSVSTAAIILSGFSAGVNAVGGEFFGSNASGGFVPVSSISLLVDAGGIEQIATIDNPQATSFFGVISTAGINSLTVNQPLDTSTSRWASVNNLIIAAPIPQPASWAMMIAGFGLVGFAMRRRQPLTA